MGKTLNTILALTFAGAAAISGCCSGSGIDDRYFERMQFEEKSKKEKARTEAIISSFAPREKAKSMLKEITEYTLSNPQILQDLKNFFANYENRKQFDYAEDGFEHGWAIVYENKQLRVIPLENDAIKKEMDVVKEIREDNYEHLDILVNEINEAKKINDRMKNDGVAKESEYQSNGMLCDYIIEKLNSIPTANKDEKDDALELYVKGRNLRSIFGSETKWHVINQFGNDYVAQAHGHPAKCGASWQDIMTSAGDSINYVGPQIVIERKNNEIIKSTYLLNNKQIVIFEK